MKTPDQKFHIFGADGEASVHLAVGSVRLGRTLRRAAGIRRYVNHAVFVALGTQVAEQIVPTAGAERHYVATPQSDADRQAAARAQLQPPRRRHARQRRPEPSVTERRALADSGRQPRAL